MPKESVILIVDDDAIVLRTFARALEINGYRVLTAEDADTAIQLAHTNLPDVILSDINMPGTDGRSFLRNLRADSDLAATQFVLMTGNTRDMERREGMDKGADDFLCKPFDVQELCRCIEARLARARVHWRVEDHMIGELKTSLHKILPHEFFTPLSGVIGMADLLKSDWKSLPPEEINEIILEIEDSAWRLHRTLRNYLYIINPAFPEINRHSQISPLAPSDLAIELESTALKAAQRHHRESDLRFDLNPPELAVDLDLLLLLLEELVENACSFSPNGSVIQVNCAPDGCLRVTDQGRGMSEAQIRKIHAFQQFERKTFEQQGLGLGLTIVRRITDAYKVDLTIQSEIGNGTSVGVNFGASRQLRD